MGKITMTLREYCELHPECKHLLDEWNYKANKGVTPDSVGYGSKKKIYWNLSYDVPMDYPIKHLRGKHFDFEWDASINARAVKGCGCPYLSNPAKAIWIGFNDLATTHPKLVKEWHPTKNGKLKPIDVMKGCNKKVYWLLEYKVPEDYQFEHLRGKEFRFEWEATVVNRATHGRGCPFLSGKAIYKGFNDLATTHPELAKEWHPSKNSFTPYDVTYGYEKNVWWHLPYDVPMDYPVEHLRGKHFDFEWEATVSSRANIQKGRNKAAGCPFLATSNSQIWKGFNDLATTHPDLAKQWHPTKNGDLTPEMVSKGNIHKEVWWLLPYDVPMDYPVEYLRGKHFDFEWNSGVATRTRSKFSGCPFLDTASSPALWTGFNDLAIRYPEIAKEWHPTKNGDLTPSDVTCGMATKIWWQCENGHEWRCAIYSRTAGNGCPVCAESKGEKTIRKVLENNNIDFKEQHTFKDRFFKDDKHPLRDDFAIFDKNGKVIGAIEFHGQQHYMPVDFAGKGDKWAKKEFEETKGRDVAKTKYLTECNIPQLIIPYWNFNNIKILVENFLQKLNLISHNTHERTPAI